MPVMDEVLLDRGFWPTSDTFWNFCKWEHYRPAAIRKN